MDADHADVVTVFLRNQGEILLVQRSDAVGTYQGAWAGVSGYVEDEPERTARMEIAEETGFDESVERVTTGQPFTFTDEELGREWTVHPFLFDVASRDVVLDQESAAAEWTAPTAILRRETVPELWRAYTRVRPTPSSIATDTTHGSAYLSIRALEILRDEAGYLASAEADPETTRTTIVALAEELRGARASMTALGNRVQRVVDQCRNEWAPANVEITAIEEIEAALAADRRAAAAIHSVIQDRSVLTLSRSGTILEALRSGPSHVFIAESRPEREGIAVAEELAEVGIPVTVCLDSAVASVLDRHPVDVIVVGADTILADGRVVNKIGTHTTAMVANAFEVPVYVVAAADKISPETDPVLEFGPDSALYDGTRELTVDNPTFDVTPSRFIKGYATDRGMLDTEEVTEIASGQHGSS